ncbi:phylloplanin-like [Aristolochia californica]|uniref:phylloplanin-like n=1 Tax=Aristolochia californica TaxID=171875 RepID=UPI0035E03CA0
MASKCLLLLLVLLVSVASLPAEAQLGGLLGLIRVRGTVFCTVDGNIGASGTATPAFATAQVQLLCGATKQVISTTTTDSNGVFSILLDPLTLLLSSLLNDCKLVVATPLSTCDASLPVGGILQSPLQFLGKTLQGFLSILNIIPGGFSFLPSLG